MLYRQAGVGTPVTVVDEAAKLGWRDGELYLEVHPSKSQLDELEESGRFAPEDIPSLYERVARKGRRGVGPPRLAPHCSRGARPARRPRARGAAGRYHARWQLDPRAGRPAGIDELSQGRRSCGAVDISGSPATASRSALAMRVLISGP